MRGSLVLLVAALVACDRGHEMSPSLIDSAAENKPIEDDPRASLDATVAPCTDFYDYACGGWIRSAAIPDDEGVWSRSFGEIGRANDEAARAILDRDARQPPADELASTQLGDFYASCLDEDAIDARGNSDVVALLGEIDASNANQVAASVALLHSLAVPALFVLEPEPDLKDSSRTSAVLRQAPLTLPESYYAEPSTIASVTEPMTRIFELVGDAPERAAAEATSAIAFERALAERFESRAVFHDASAAPQLVNGPALSRTAAVFGWKSYFGKLTIEPPSVLHIATPQYLTKLNALLARTLETATGRDALRSFLRWQLVHSLAPTSSSKLAAEDFRITRLRTGAPGNSPRWKRCLQATESALGAALAIPFRRRLDPARVENALSQTRALANAMRAEIAVLPWMDAPTRELALRKLAQLRLDIASAPLLPTAYVPPITRANFLNDVILLRKYRSNGELRTIGTRASAPKPWTVTPNANFDPRRNQLVLLAGILAPPIFYGDRAGDDATLGTILGHELTHALSGRYDANGNLDPWWTTETSNAYRQRSACVQGDLAVSVVDELMADEGGLRTAYRALEQDRPAEGDAKRTRDQAYFTAFAQLWCAKLRPEALRDFAATNAHPLPSERVNRSVSQLPEFAAAFSCRPGEPMAPVSRCNAW